MPQDTPSYSNHYFASNIYPVGDAFYKPALRNEADRNTELMLIKRRKPHKVRATRNFVNSFQLRYTVIFLVLSCLSIGLIFENLSHANRCKLGLSICSFMRLLCEVPRAALSADLSKICDIAGQTHYIGSPNVCMDFNYEKKANIPFNTAIRSTPEVASTVQPQENYASRKSGAHIISAFTSPTYKLRPPGYLASVARLITGTEFHQIDIVRPSHILDETVVDGECWEAAAGSSRVGIQLSNDTSISYVSLNYIPAQQLSPHAASRAPDDISIWGLVPATVALPKSALTHDMNHFLQKGSRLPKAMVEEKHFVQLGRIRYNASSSTPWQQFPIAPPFSNIRKIHVVVADFETNLGGDTTCIYMLGIHGPGNRRASLSP